MFSTPLWKMWKHLCNMLTAANRRTLCRLEEDSCENYLPSGDSLISQKPYSYPITTGVLFEHVNPQFSCFVANFVFEWTDDVRENGVIENNYVHNCLNCDRRVLMLLNWTIVRTFESVRWFSTFRCIFDQMLETFILKHSVPQWWEDLTMNSFLYTLFIVSIPHCHSRYWNICVLQKCV